MDEFGISSLSNIASVFCILQDKTAILPGAKHLFLKSKLRLLRNIQLQPQPQLPCLLPRAGLYPLQLQQQGSSFLPAFISRHAIFFLSSKNCFRWGFRSLGDSVLLVFFLTPVLFCDFPVQLARKKQKSASNQHLKPTSRGPVVALIKDCKLLSELQASLRG